MSRMYFPTGARSATAVPGTSDIRDENVHTAVVVAHGGGGSTKLYTVPQGQAIPELKGSAITATANAHQTTYTEATTLLQKAGELGNNVGDAAIRNIGIAFEQAAYTASSGAARAFGMTQFEVADTLAKTYIQMKVGTKDQIQGGSWLFPGHGGANGSIATTGNATTVAIANNGVLGQGRALKTPILVERRDTLVAVFAVNGTATLAFSVTGSDGQPSLVFVNCFASVRGDVR